jgi:hypothetical protein
LFSENIAAGEADADNFDLFKTPFRILNCFVSLKKEKIHHNISFLI